MKFKSVLAGFFVAFYATAAVAASSPPPSYVNTGAIVRQATGLNVAHGGDSTAWYGNFANPALSGVPFNNSQYQVGSAANSYLGNLAAISRNGINYDPMTFGYPGVWGGLIYAIPITPGACSPNSTITFTPSAPTGTPAVTAGTFTLTTNAAGQVPVGVKAFPASQGSGYVATPTFTATSGGTCGTPPTFTWAFSGAGSYGAFGDTAQGLLYRIQQDVCPAQPDIFFISAGVNDLRNGATYAQIIGYLAADVAAAQACGIQRVVLAPITPVGNGTNVLTTAQDQTRLRINRWMQWYQQRNRLQANGAAQVVAFDVDELWVDPTNGNGNAQTAMTIDYLHPSPQGAFYWALQALDAIHNWLSPSLYLPSSYNDYYFATNNPAGNLMQVSGAPYGLFYGVSGAAAGGCTPSANVATAWTVAGSFTGTPTCGALIETNGTRLDGLAGQRQVAAVSETGGGTNDQATIFASYNLGSSTNISFGTDALYGTVDIDISNLSNALYVGASIQEGVSSGKPQWSMCLWGTYFGSTYPLPTSATLAKLNAAKNLADFGLSGAGSYRISCKMPAITTQALENGWGEYVKVAGAGAWSATIKAANFAIRKNQP